MYMYKCVLCTVDLQTSVSVFQRPGPSHSTSIPYFPMSWFSSSSDQLIKEASLILEDANFSKRQSILSYVCPLLKAARDSVDTLQLPTFSRALKITATKQINDYHIKKCYAELGHLKVTVQSKFREIVALKSDYPCWNNIVSGLPSGQLSFLLRAGSDTLPTPLNLSRWKLQTDPQCPLCNSRCPMTLHILNGCPVTLNQGRYTWRYNSVLASIVSFHLSSP